MILRGVRDRYRLRFFVVCVFLLVGVARGQDNLGDLLAQPGTDLSDPISRDRVTTRMREISGLKRQSARDRATKRGLPLRITRPNGVTQEIADFEGEKPIYFTTHNANASISTGATIVRTGYQLDGTGVTIGLWDGGSGRSTHQEFGTRLSVMDGAASIDHATHVAGTLIASGVVANAKGMSPGAIVNSYDWNSDSTEMTLRGASAPNQAGKIYLSNHSYGYISGWNYVNNGTRVWEWYGEGTTSTSIDQDFGKYNTYARDEDALAFAAPYYLIFRSAGNDRVDSPSVGQTVSLTPGGTSVVTYDTALHPNGDGNYRSGFETIANDALAKNVMTIGSASDAVTNGLRDPNKADSSSFSSWGPTDDGRIKPDLVANGDGLYSSTNASNNSYDTYSGTSMASPNAVGSTALLIQQYTSLFPGQAMRASTLKGLLIHTADDRGNVGPDYKYGWGLINVKVAADLIADHASFSSKQYITENQLNASTVSRTQSFIWDGVSSIRATLSWTDPAGTATTTSDSRTVRLVNNLNLKIVAPNGTIFYPYVMPFVSAPSAATMDSPATTGVNNTDNVEQVSISAPSAAGAYQAVVSFSGTLTNNLQNYSLILSGSSADLAPHPPISLSGISPASGMSGNVTVDLTGSGFLAGSVIKLKRVGQTDIVGTSVQLIGSSLRCQFNLTGAAAGLWDVVGTNPDLSTSTLTAGFSVLAAIWNENFDSNPVGWTSLTTTGSNSWSLVNSVSYSPTSSYFAAGPASRSTVNLISPIIAIPSLATNLQLSFWHSYDLQYRRDGGRLEFSVAGGTWFDVTDAGSGASFASNGYGSTISSGSNDFNGKLAWSGNSNGYIKSTVNLTDVAKYAGKNLQIRWRLATNGATASTGWSIDSIALTGSGDFTNQAPAISTAATGNSGEIVTDPDGTVYQIVRSSSLGLAVGASDNGGESLLTYTWSLSSGPGAAVSFSVNGTNAAKSTVVSFSEAGDYDLTVSIRDVPGLVSSSLVHVRVLQTASEVRVSPGSASLRVGATQTFSAATLDQFGLALAVQPTGFSWLVNGGGSINSSGVFAANAAGGPFVITASGGGLSNTALVTVLPGLATVALGNLTATYDGTAKVVSASTTPSGLAVALTYNGTSTVPVNAGTYAVVGTITDANYQGTGSGELLIGKATPTWVSVPVASGLVYGQPLSSALLSGGEASVAGSFAFADPSRVPSAGTADQTVVFTPSSNNYEPIGRDISVTVGKASATVSLENLTATYDGTAKVVSASTTPSGLAVALTYNGTSTAPVNAGSYAVDAVIVDLNYVGTGSGELAIIGMNYLSWQEQEFSSVQILASDAAVAADPDGDGLVNLVEYGLGSNPHGFTRLPPPAVDAGFLSMTFDRPVGRPDVICHVEASSDLKTWAPVPADVIAQTATTQTVRARIERPADQRRMFMRLKFQQNP